MDSTMYGLLGTSGQNLGLDVGLLGNGQPPQAGQQQFGRPGTMPGGGPQGGVQPIPGAQPMPQAQPPMTNGGFLPNLNAANSNAIATGLNVAMQNQARPMGMPAQSLGLTGQAVQHALAPSAPAGIHMGAAGGSAVSTPPSAPGLMPNQTTGLPNAVNNATTAMTGLPIPNGVAPGLTNFANRLFGGVFGNGTA